MRETIKEAGRKVGARMLLLLLALHTLTSLIICTMGAVMHEAERKRVNSQHKQQHTQRPQHRGQS